MLPFMEKLTLRLGEAWDSALGGDDASRVEGVTARGGLGRDGAKVGADECRGIGGGLKALELRVTCVAARATEEHCLRKEGFPPEGNQAGGVEMTRMQGPETHETIPT